MRDNSHRTGWIVSIVFHVTLLLISFPHFALSPLTKIQKTIIPVQMVYTQDAVNPDPTPKAKSKQLTSTAPDITPVKEAPTRLPGDRDTPLLSNKITPVYPKTALNNEWQGVVVVKVRVSATGQPAGIKLIQSSGHDILDRSFMMTIKQYYTFKPKRVVGEDIESELILRHEFRL